MKDDTPSPSDIAVALHFDGKRAPRVTAKGRGHIAAEILRVAREHDVPISETPELVEVLAKVEIGSEIPEALYKAVAEVIAFAYLLKGRTIDES